jgi:hypothetical protein
MAGLNLGAPAPAASLTLTPSRTRRLHGAFPLGAFRFVVASSRQRAESLGVLIGAGPLDVADCQVAGRCTPAQARLMARALLEAAEAVDNARRLPPLERFAGQSVEPAHGVAAADEPTGSARVIACAVSMIDTLEELADRGALPYGMPQKVQALREAIDTGAKRVPQQNGGAA